ncbi:MAG: 16S rRNA (cytosine(967)-C(5))-methyltransferase RsmB [Comamonadaceae bacterium]|nr:MAG: 16S rRNA (cytosine(967)-C(5))-methyltransferase RsmB [Comamonadaceae bacterium]
MSVQEKSLPLWQLLQATAGVVASVRAGKSGTAAVESVPQALRPGVQALAFQVWRNLGRAQVLRTLLASKPPAPATDALLCVALALVWNEADAPYDTFTLVNQSVEALKRNPATKAHANFVNACLRRFLRERVALVAASSQYPEALWNHPLWWIKRVQKDHPQDWQAILQAANAHPPMTLRVNIQKKSVAAYLDLLKKAEIAVRFSEGSALELSKAVAVGQLPGFNEGWVSVQDAAAQIAAPLLLSGLPQEAKILDACAAPGGKTAHILELSKGSVLAVEMDGVRAQRITQNLNRLGLQATLSVANAAQTKTWWDGVLFDGILLDAPCTASGIVRRHPDVRWLRRETDIAQLAQLQKELLTALWPLLRNGGRMVYCTCSLFLAEGQQQIQTFLASHSDATLLSSPGHLIPKSPANTNSLPDNRAYDQDGFFYAHLEKRSA